MHCTMRLEFAINGRSFHVNRKLAHPKRVACSLFPPVRIVCAPFRILAHKYEGQRTYLIRQVIYGDLRHASQSRSHSGQKPTNLYLATRGSHSGIEVRQGYLHGKTCVSPPAHRGKG